MTRDRLVDCALRSAARDGLAAVTFGALARQAKISKSAVLRHFTAKEALDLAIVDEATRRFFGAVWAPAAAAAAGRPRLEALVEAWLAWETKTWAHCGCPLRALSAELDDRPGAAREHLRSALERFRRSARAALRTLRSPPLSEAVARDAYFELRSLFLGHAEARRMMGDVEAEQHMAAALRRLLDRLQGS
ncbi:TetR/AcrR family transcriptional regulator [Caulobacter sp. KR2-114]|jgi:AcrR family transcriptional regulator|uniref:TetR/AcrR family transcriptional regulator n=1 Tax=Caulobacter sp. KR2-114 TaxID=3400912 RepID=UPI003C01E761